MTGFSVIGDLFTDRILWLEGRAFWYAYMMIFLFVLSIYLLNSFADYKRDRQSSRLADLNKWPRKTYFRLMALSTITFLAMAASINWSVFAASSLSFALWLAYYLKPLRLKESILLGTGIHLICGILHFQLGYGYAAAITWESILIGGYFGLLLATGHFNHELLDFDDDSATGTRTSAVRLGAKQIYLFRDFLLIASCGYLAVLFSANVLNGRDGILLLSGHLIMLALLFSGRMNQPKSFQVISRVLVFAACSSIAIFKLAL